MAIFDGSFSTTVPNLTDSVRLVNNNGYLLSQAKNNLIGNVIGTDDSTLNKWEQGVRNLNTQQLINQYNALTPEQLRAYELQGIDPRQAIADRAGFIYNDFDKDLESARAGAETTLSDYNDRWLENQAKLMSNDEHYNAYQKGEDPIANLAKSKGMRHFSRAKADTLYDQSVLAGRLETQNRLGEIIDKGNRDTRRAFYNGDFKTIAPDMNLRQQDIESAKSMGKLKAISLLSDPFKRELRNAHERGEDITSESVRNTILEKLKSEYGLENSGINSSNINIAFDPNTQDFVDNQKYMAEFNQTQFGRNVKKALETDKEIEDLLGQDWRSLDYRDVFNRYDKIIRENYPDVSEDQIAEFISKDKRLQKHIQTVLEQFKNDPTIQNHLKILSNPGAHSENLVKESLMATVNTLLGKNQTMSASMKQAMIQGVAEAVGLADTSRSLLQRNKGADEYAQSIYALNKTFNSSEMGFMIKDLDSALSKDGNYKTALNKTAANDKNLRVALSKKIYKNLQYKDPSDSTINFVLDFLIQNDVIKHDDDADTVQKKIKDVDLGGYAGFNRELIENLDKASKVAQENRANKTEGIYRDIEPPKNK